MAKFRLEIDLGYDYEVLGICSAVSDYRLVWEINQTCNTQLAKSDELFKKVLKKDKSQQYFSMYCQYDDEQKQQLFFVKNQNAAAYLVPELGQIDYFFFFKNYHNLDLSEWIGKLKTCDCIQAVMEFLPEAYKSFDTIVFDDYEKNQNSSHNRTSMFG
jgi:hypothetical protein